jgi:Ca2+-binding EF-hand superfamily protein
MVRFAIVVAALIGLTLIGEAADPPKGKMLQGDPDKVAGMILERMDANKDGKISRDEAKGPLAERFDQIDRNKDGFIDRDELKQMVRTMQALGKAKDKGKFAKGFEKGFNPPAASSRFPDFDSMDKDADGRLTREEVKGTALEKVFDEIDTNKDGKIDPKEYEAYQKKAAK